jgi:hypothetical protein
MNLHVSSDVAMCTNTPLIERCQARASDEGNEEEKWKKWKKWKK